MKQRAREASWHQLEARVLGRPRRDVRSVYSRCGRSRREDLELEPKRRLVTALNTATRNTRQGAYHKIHHAADLLRRLDSRTVRNRCPSCDRLFVTLDQALP